MTYFGIKFGVNSYETKILHFSNCNNVYVSFSIASQRVIFREV